MNKKYRKCLLKALTQVLDEIGFSKYKVLRKVPKDLQTDLLTTVGITGDMAANLMLQADLASAEQFIHLSAEHMGVSLDDEKNFGNFHKTAMAEIANQISGRATILLADAGFDCNITPPTIISGSNVFISSIGMTDAITRLVKGSFGVLKFHVGIKRVGRD